MNVLNKIFGIDLKDFIKNLETDLTEIAFEIYFGNGSHNSLTYGELYGIGANNER